MPNERLDDLLRACTVDIVDGRGHATGFFVGPRTLLARAGLPDMLPGMLEIRAQDGSLLAERHKTAIATSVQVPFGPTAWFGKGIVLLETEPLGHHQWTKLEFQLPREGDPLLVVGFRHLITGTYQRNPRNVPYEIDVLGIARDAVPRELIGAPVLNLRTGGVWAVIAEFELRQVDRRDRSPHAQLIAIERPRSSSDVPSKRPSIQVLPLGHIYELRNGNLDQWQEAVHLQGWERALRHAEPEDSSLLFRLYIPSARLYAAETARLLSLFRDWLIVTRGHGIRQAGYSTAAGQMVEFFSDANGTETPELAEVFDGFSSFLTLCNTDREAAVIVLSDTVLGRAASIDLVDRFRRETKLIELQMRYERRRRVLSLQQDIEEELVRSSVDLSALPSIQLAALIDRMVPGPATAAPLELLAAPLAEGPAQVTVNINQQFIRAAQSTIINSVAGNANLGPQAIDLLRVIERFGGHDTATLQSAVYELDDPDAPADKRSGAKRRLMQFVGQLGDVAKEVGAELLTKYLESKGA